MFAKFSITAVLALAPLATLAHYGQMNDPSLTYYWYNGTDGVANGDYVVKDGDKWSTLSSNLTGNVVTINSQSDYDNLDEKPYTGLLAAPVEVNHDGLGVPYMSDFVSYTQFINAVEDTTIVKRPSISCVIMFCRNAN